MTSLFVALAIGMGPAPTDVEFFEKHVRPLLVEKCLKCHGPEKKRGGLRVDSREALLKGGNNGPSVVPGKPSASLLVKAVRHAGELKMPPGEKGKLGPQSVALLEDWVQRGAPWAAEKGPVKGPSEAALARKTHWSFRPITRPKVPDVSGEAANPIDRFLQAKLQAKGLSFAPAAGRAVYIRRVSFSLTGLPPTPDEVKAFVEDK